MPEFQYSARNKSGVQVNGKRTALSADDLAMQLQNESLIPLEISLAKTLAKTKLPFLQREIFKGKVSQDELQMLCRQLYTVLKAGIPIALAVSRLSETTRDKQLAATLQQVLASLNQGRNLYVSLSQFSLTGVGVTTATCFIQYDASVGDVTNMTTTGC